MPAWLSPRLDDAAVWKMLTALASSHLP